MPKRVVDGEALWTSVKLMSVEPEDYRAEYANLLPLALGTGTFEADTRKVWQKVYAYNRPSMTPEKLALILDAFESARMLFRWTDDAGKLWGFFPGIDRLLPGPARLKHEKKGLDVPREALNAFLRGDAPAQVESPKVESPKVESPKVTPPVSVPKAAPKPQPKVTTPHTEPFDALDFAMTREEPFAGVEASELRRVIFFNWKIAKPYWNGPQGKITSEARLEKVFATMAGQTPPDFKISGSALIPIREADPECEKCEGQGFVPGPNEAYKGELEFLEAKDCACVKIDNKPWKRWSKNQ